MATDGGGGKRVPKSTKHAKTPLFPPCSQLAYSRSARLSSRNAHGKLAEALPLTRFLDKLGDQRRAPEWTFNRSASVLWLHFLGDL